MKGRITREHDARQAYDGVYFEGGSAITDADLNAGFDAQRRVVEDLQKAWIAPAGTPDDGWKVTDLSQFNNGGQLLVNFNLQPGHYGLDGTLIKNTEVYPYNDQPHALSSELSTGFQLQVPTVAEVEATANDALYDAVVLDVREVPVRVTEDSELDEVAMRSDPATRTKFSAKVRTIRDVASTCAAARSEVLDQIAGPNGTIVAPSPKIRSRGRLRVQLGVASNGDNPCAPELSTGYFGRLNHTIKVMLTASDQFVWAYQNGEGLHRATMQDATTLRLITSFDDSALFPISGQIVEVCSWDMSLPNGERTAVPLGQFHAISAGYSPQDETLTLDTALDPALQDWYNTRLATGTEPFLFLRFWEPATTPMAISEPTGLTRPLAQTGVLLDFLSPGKPGDQWTFSVRVNANETVFPKRMLEPAGQPPEGLNRYADLLALIHWTLVEGTVTGHIHDCRQRIRPLWKQRDCCTFKVGDGVSSFGDFDLIQDAVEALPHEGGKICLLPGRHTSGVAISKRENVTIEGCGQRSVILPASPDTPLFTVEDCINITLKDMYFLDGTALAIAGARNEKLQLNGIETRGRGSAIALLRNIGLRITRCIFFAEAEPSIIPAADFPTLRPLAFVGGKQIEIRDNGFRCAPSDLTLQSLGGLQIASNSSDLWIENNVISGGLGHGLTFGHVTKISAFGISYGDQVILQGVAAEMRMAVEAKAEWHRNGRAAEVTGPDMVAVSSNPNTIAAIRDLMEDAILRIDENPLEISAVASQGCIGIDPTVPQPTPDDDEQEWDEYFVEGEITHIHVIDNEIHNMGGSGISTPAWNISNRRPFGALQVVDLIVDRNHFKNLCRVAIATTLADAEIQEIGFGAIALEYAEGAKLSNNVIEDIGLDVRTPSTGIYLREVVNGHIHDNVIRNIGRAERIENVNISGISGGIIIDQCWPIYANPFAVPARLRERMGMQMLKGSITDVFNKDQKLSAALAAQRDDLKLPRGEAIRIQNNAVTVNFGMALDVRGSGAMHIADNHLTSLAARANARRPRLSLAVSVVNTELPAIELITFLIGLFEIANVRVGDRKLSTLLLRLLAIWIYFTSSSKYFDVIQYENNHSYLENFNTRDDGISICAIVSPFDVQVSNNVMKSLHLDTGAFLHFFGAGYYSTQCFANRFETRPNDGVLGAALTIGIGNSTSFNHASQPIRTLKLSSISFTGDANLTP